MSEAANPTDSAPWRSIPGMSERLHAAAGRRFNVATNGRMADTTILFLHSELQNWRTFYRLYNGLHHDAALVALDFRGHGKSDKAPAYRAMDYVEDALTLLRVRPEKRFVVYGHSLGAMVALAVAAIEPSRVEGLILEEPPFSTATTKLRGSAAEAYYAGVRACLAASREPERLFACFSEIIIGQKPNGSPLQVKEQRDEETRRYLADSLAMMDPKTLDPVLQGDWLLGYDMQSLARRVKCPTLLLQGDLAHGAMFSDAEVNLLSLLLGTKCQVMHFAGAGHHLHGPKAGDIIELIRAAITAG